MAANLDGGPPPPHWPQVLHDWLAASVARDPAGWRACMADDARSIGVDAAVTTGAESITANLVAYYSVLDPDEIIERWIEGTPPGVFVWHGVIEPGTPHATPFCTICTLAGGKIAELRFFADGTNLARLTRRSAQ